MNLIDQWFDQKESTLIVERLDLTAPVQFLPTRKWVRGTIFGPAQIRYHIESDDAVPPQIPELKLNPTVDGLPMQFYQSESAIYGQAYNPASDEEVGGYLYQQVQLFRYTGLPNYYIAILLQPDPKSDATFSVALTLQLGPSFPGNPYEYPTQLFTGQQGAANEAGIFQWTCTYGSLALYPKS